MPRPEEASLGGALAELFELRRFVGRDAVSEPFSYRLELSAEREVADLGALLGEIVVVTLHRSVAEPRYFHGHVVAATLLGRRADRHHYEVELQPWLAFLQRRVDCRHFLDLTLIEVLEKVFERYGSLARFENRCGACETREYTCQYNESDFVFVSRLLQREGIYYFFEHSEDEHVLVFDDDSTAADPRPGYKEVTFHPVDARTREVFEAEHLDTWTPMAALRPGRFTTRSFDFKNPRDPLEGERREDFEHPQGDIEVYCYPELHLAPGEAAERAKRRLEGEQTDARLFLGTGNARGLVPGSAFALTGFGAPDAREDCFVRAVTHVVEISEERSGADAGPTYACTVEAQPLQRPYRPPLTVPKPVIAGPQTAVVTGPAGEEIHCDEHGRVKLRFHWDRLSPFDDTSSCWVRCAQSWASAGFGTFRIPRVGDEVLVTFVDGDPDRPIVTGYVYNGLTMPPYGLPGTKTRGGIKTNTIGGGGFNELSMDDTPGQEDVYLHAQYDMRTVIEHDHTGRVGNDETLNIGHDRTETVDHDESVSIGNDRTITIGHDLLETVVNDRTRVVQGAESRAITRTLQETVGMSANFTVAVSRAAEIGATETLIVGATRNTSIGRDDGLDVGNAFNVDVGKAWTVGVGKTIAISAGDEAVVKVGKASLTLKKDGTIIVDGKDLTLSAAGDLNMTAKGKATLKATGNVIIKGSKILEN